MLYKSYDSYKTKVIYKNNKNCSSQGALPNSFFGGVIFSKYERFSNINFEQIQCNGIGAFWWTHLKAKIYLYTETSQSNWTKN